MLLEVFGASFVPVVYIHKLSLCMDISVLQYNCIICMALETGYLNLMLLVCFSYFMLI